MEALLFTDAAMEFRLQNLRTVRWQRELGIQYTHTNNGPILLGVWYRPQRDSANHIESFDDEFGRLALDHISHIVVGDLNLWHKKWLRLSPYNTPLGEMMQQFCLKYSLEEITGAPARGPNLLDLFLTSSPHHIHALLLPPIADHCATLGTFRFLLPQRHTITQQVWDYEQA